MKHESTPIVDTNVNHGLSPSFLIGKGSAESAIKESSRFFIKTNPAIRVPC